jgi:hypothetical protein
LHSGKKFADSLMPAFVFNWNIKRNIKAFSSSILMKTSDESKSFFNIMSSMSIISLQNTLALSRLDKSDGVYISSTSGFNANKLAPLVIDQANPEYTTLKKQKGSHKTYKIPLPKRKIVSTGTEIEEKLMKRLRPGDISNSDKQRLLEIANASVAVKKNWSSICETFNQVATLFVA